MSGSRPFTPAASWPLALYFPPLLHCGSHSSLSLAPSGLPAPLPSLVFLLYKVLNLALWSDSLTFLFIQCLTIIIIIYSSLFFRVITSLLRVACLSEGWRLKKQNGCLRRHGKSCARVPTSLTAREHCVFAQQLGIKEHAVSQQSGCFPHARDLAWI